MDRGKARFLRQRFADLGDAVATGVQQDDGEAAPVGTLGEQILDQLFIVGHVGVDEHQFARSGLFRRRKADFRRFIEACRLALQCGDLVFAKRIGLLPALDPAVTCFHVVTRHRGLLHVERRGIGKGQVGRVEDAWFQFFQNGGACGFVVVVIRHRWGVSAGYPVCLSAL